MKAQNVKLKDICDVFISRIKKDKYSTYNPYVITPSNLYPNNILTNMSRVNISESINEKYILQSNDILIKRLNPMFVNIFNGSNKSVYASSNVIIVRAKENIIPKYIASLFEIDGVDAMTHYVKKGVTIQAISAKELSEITIDLPSIEEQKLIGELWELNQRKIILQQKLIENESAYMRYIIKNFIKEEK